MQKETTIRKACFRKECARLLDHNFRVVRRNEARSNHAHLRTPKSARTIHLRAALTMSRSDRLRRLRSLQRDGGAGKLMQAAQTRIAR